MNCSSGPVAFTDISEGNLRERRAGLVAAHGEPELLPCGCCYVGDWHVDHSPAWREIETIDWMLGEDS